MAVVKTRKSPIPSELRTAFCRLLTGAAVLSLSLSTSIGSTSALGQGEPATSQWTMSNAPLDVDRRSSSQSVEMIINSTRDVTTDEIIKEISVQNPTVVDATPVEGGNRIMLSAKATGVTQINLKTVNQTVHTIEVLVVNDVREVEAILRRAFPQANLEILPLKAGCIVRGFVSSDEHVEQVMRILEQYFASVINQISVTGVHTIQLETQIMEVSRTKLRSLGIDWALANGDDVITQTAGGILNAVGTTFSGAGSQTLTIGVAQNSTQFFTAINALRQNNLVKVLASPTLTAEDGRPASFNSGGEIPIVVPAGLGQVGIQYREFGTRLDFVAKVRDNGRIWLEVRPYVSEIDATRSVSIQGVEVPGLRSRFLETGVELGAGQTLALGGLLQVRSETVSRGIPGLSEMPYVGALFRSTRDEQNEIELLITVTPHFAGAMDPCEVPQGVPGVNSQSPTDKDLYLRGYIETPITGSGGSPVATPGMYESVPLMDGGYETVPNSYGPTPAGMMESYPHGVSTPGYSTQMGVQGQIQSSGSTAPGDYGLIQDNVQAGNQARAQNQFPSLINR